MICYSPFSDVVQKELPFSISLNNQQNTRQNVDFVYYDFPQVSRLEPNKGPDTGGTKVHIRGQYFNPSFGLSINNNDITMCKFGKLSLTTAEVVSSTEIICTSPASFVDREVPVEITLNNQEWTDDGILFHYYHPPLIYGIEPKIGPVNGGTEVKIIGSNFADTGFVMCKFGAIIVKGTYINENELRCVSPQVEKPGYVNLYIAIRADEFSSGTNTKFLYYDNPSIDFIEPMCGPESGFTQITVKGKNFANTGSDYVKCVFGNIYTNATVYSDTEIKCDSPSVLNFNGENEKNITEYDVQITLNSYDLSGPKQKFYYYKDTFTAQLEPIYGPKTGNTTVVLSGMDFTQPGACNVTVRIATYHIKPDLIAQDKLTFTTPAVNFTGATVVQVALNGRQFDKDILVHNRDTENTFYYYKEPLIRTLSPKKGPTNGGSEISLFGIGFDSVFYSVKNAEDKKLFYRFIDSETGEVLNSPKEIYADSSHIIKVIAPQVYKNNTKALIEISYNNQNFDIGNKDLIYTYYILPNVTSINPEYGPLKAENQKVEIGLDNYVCTDNCESIVCRFKSKSNIFYQAGVYERPNFISCLTPNVNMPESYNVEVSFIDDDFTNNNFNYTYYDPYVIRVVPQMVSTKGNTLIDIHGFGFANSGEFLKAQFGSADNRLRCDIGNCIVQAEFVSDTLIRAKTFPQNLVNEAESGSNIGFKKFAVEASVYNNDFTNNNVPIFYYDEPEIIQDIFTYNLPINSTDKELIAQSLVYNLPANADTVIIIPIDSSKINKYYSQFNDFANYTCSFTMVDDTTKTKITSGIITSYPIESELNNLFICQSPIWENTGKAIVQISLNGVDFSETVFNIVFTDPIKIHSIEPPCGPRVGGTKVRIVGNGLLSSKEYGVKFGVQNLIPMDTVKLIRKIPKDGLLPKISSDFEFEEIEVIAPQAPVKDKTLGGPDYIAYAKRNYLPLEDHVTKYFPTNYFHTNFEYYYYHQPYVQSISPHGSIVTGGTNVLVVGAWFDFKPEYGVKPYCKFGNKVVEGEYLSTVRIKCVAPAYDTSNIRVSFDVSLNGQDFTNSDIEFTYYNDYTKAKFYSIEPTSGPDTGGTNIKVYGESFTGLLNPDEFLCQFFPENKNLQPKSVPAGFQDFGNNKTAVICNTPGGWESGTKADIRITFDGQNYFDTGFDFYFYKILGLNPSSGPSTGNGPIQVMGSGFQNSTKVKCMVNKVEYTPINIYPDRILCPMPQAPFGKNFTGSVDFSVTLNGIDWRDYDNGFYYYIQPLVESVFPTTGPSKGNALVKVYGKGFRNNFPGSDAGCQIGHYIGKGKVLKETEIECEFNDLPLLKTNKPLNFTVALNSYSFTPESANFTFTPYGITLVSPSSGPKEGGTRIEVKGAGFYDSKNIRCRFGVPGWYGYTAGQYIDYNRIVCSSPVNFALPEGSGYPFSVPLSIAFNDDEFSKLLI